VWDTYVEKTDGRVMHFDILAPEIVSNTEEIYGYGRSYLAEKGQASQMLSAQECKFCHIEEASAEVREIIAIRGYHIIEMQNCD